MATQTVDKAPASPSTPVVEPYIAPETHLREFTPRALILGTILGMIFGASSLYLVLRVGLTVSASIPVAVISLTLFRLGSRVFGFRDATILENNIAQTAGSDQIVVGWRAMNKPGVKVGIKLFTPLDKEGKDWRQTLIDDNTMACEDLTVADLNGDGKLDIVAAGRATKNVKIYFNEGTSSRK